MNYKATLIAAGQTVSFFISGFFIPLLGLILTPVPLVIASIRNGRREALTALVLSFAVIGVLVGWSFAFLFLFCFGFMAIGTWEGMRRQWRVESTALLGGLLPVAVLSLTAARFFIHTQKNPVPFLETAIQQQRILAVKLYTELSLPEVATAVSSVPDIFIHYFVLLIPGIVVTGMVLLAVLCSILARAMIMRRPGSAPALARSSLAEWHAPDVWVWGLIAALALIMAPNEAARFTGFNLAVIYAVVYLTQGVAVVDHYLRKARIQPFMRGLIHTLILALPSIVFVIALGVVDIWADFRKVRGPAKAVS